jgi:hypothetical protein
VVWEVVLDDRLDNLGTPVVESTLMTREGDMAQPEGEARISGDQHCTGRQEGIPRTPPVALDVRSKAIVM